MEYQKETPQQWVSLSAFTDEGSGDAAALPFRLSRYDKARRQSLRMADYALSTNGRKEAAKLHDCGSWLLFRDYYTEGKVRLAAAPFCHQHLLCPLCAIRRGARSLKVYLDRFNHIRQQHTQSKLYLVTFTVRNGSDLIERYNHLSNAMARYQHQRRDYLGNPAKRKYVEMAKAIGAVGSYEIKRGKGSNQWHPHCHMIWLCNEAPNQEQLRKEWEEVTGDSFMVDVTPFRDDQEPVEGFLEVFKYAVKFSDMALEDNWYAYQKLRRTRLLFSFGAFYGVKVPSELTDELLDDLPYVELLFRHGRAGYELRTNTNERFNRRRYVKARQKPKGPSRNEDPDRHSYNGTSGDRTHAEATRAQARGGSRDDARGAGEEIQRAPADPHAGSCAYARSAVAHAQPGSKVMSDPCFSKVTSDPCPGLHSVKIDPSGSPDGRS